MLEQGAWALEHCGFMLRIELMIVGFAYVVD